MNTFFKIFLTSCILIILSSGTDVKAQRKFITSDFLIGLNFAEMDIEGMNRDKKPKMGMTVGFNLNFKVKGNFQVQTGVYVTKKGLKQDITYQSPASAVNIVTISDTVRNWTSNYIQVPLCIGYEYYITKSFAVNVNAGVYAGYGFRGRYKEENSLSYLYLDTGQRDDGTVNIIDDDNYSIYGLNGWRRMDYGLIGRVGLVYDIYTINLSYEYGLHNVNNRDRAFRGNPSLKNRNLTLALGFRF